MQDLKILYRLLFYFTSLAVCSGNIKKRSKNEKNEKKALKMTSLFFLFVRPPTLNLKKKIP